MKTFLKTFFVSVSIWAVLLLFIIVIASGCTKNQRVKRWGGSATIELPENQKLLHVTWKDDNLWYLTRPMTAKDTAETYTFQEKSNFGMVEGTYKIKESR